MQYHLFALPLWTFLLSIFTGNVYTLVDEQQQQQQPAMDNDEDGPKVDRQDIEVKQSSTHWWTRYRQHQHQQK